MLERRRNAEKCLERVKWEYKKFGPKINERNSPPFVVQRLINNEQDRKDNRVDKISEIYVNLLRKEKKEGKERKRTKKR